VKVGAENKKQVQVMVALLAILALVAIYNFRDSIWGSSAAAPAPASAQPKSSGALPAQDGSDPRLRLDILDNSRKVKLEASNRNPFAVGVVIPPVVASVKGTPTPTPMPPTPTPTPRIPIKYYGFVASRPGEPRKIFLQPEGKEQVYIAQLGDIVDRRYRVVQIQPTSVWMEDVVTNSRQQIQVEPMPPGGR